MNMGLSIRAVDHRSVPVAEELRAVQFAAYSQEAKLLGVRHFPPLMRTVNDVQRGAEAYLAAFVGARMVGAVAVEPANEGAGACIASAVVLPEFQRRGIGSRLVEAVVAAHGGSELYVQTGAKNLPALALYSRAGFVVSRRWHVAPELLELVALVRQPDALVRAHDAA
jgi:ribosomal protein S18 acetylase RimI-like enzyme